MLLGWTAQLKKLELREQIVGPTQPVGECQKVGPLLAKLAHSCDLEAGERIPPKLEQLSEEQEISTKATTPKLWVGVGLPMANMATEFD